MKKKIAVMVAASMIAAGVTGCSGKNGEGSAVPMEELTPATYAFSPSMDAEEKVVINVNGSWSNFQALEAAAVNWNKIYPNAEINYVKIDAYNSMLSKLASGENPPEIVMFDLASYYEEKDAIVNSLADLSDIGMDLSVVNSGAVASQTIDGKLCDLPWGVVATGFVANTTLLSSLGLEIPETHEEFTDVCQKLVEAGYTPIQGCSEVFCKYLMNNDIKYKIMNSEDGQSLHDSFDEATEGCGSFFADEFAQMIDLVNKKFISNEVNKSISDVYEGNILHFFEGNTPFLCFNTEGFSGMKKRESKSEAFIAQPFEYEFVPLPVCTEEPVLSMSFLPGLAVVSGSENEAWAKEFLRFVCSSELNEMAEVKGVPAVTVAGSEDARYSHIGKIKAESCVIPYEDTVSALADETFAFALEGIAEGTITDVDGAVSLFESHLSSFRD